MTLTSMPNGEVVDIADGTPPDVIAKIKAQYPATNNSPATRKERVAAGMPRSQRQQEASKLADQLEKTGGSHGALGTIINSATFGLPRILGSAVMAGTEGVYKAIQKGDIGEIGHTYTVNSDAQKELQRRYEEENPVASTLADVGGAVISPVGTGAKLVQGAGRVAAKAGAKAVGGVLERGGAKLAAAGPVAQSIAAGGVGGALNAASNADNWSDVPGAALQGGALGAAAGGALGSLTHLGTQVARTVLDRSAGSAERKAYERIAQLLDNGNITPDAARKEILATDKAGGNAVVGDLTHGLQAESSYLSRKQSLPSSNQFADLGKTRVQARRENFANQVEQNAEAPVRGFDAMNEADRLKASIKGTGMAKDAEGGIMDTPLNNTPELQATLREAHPVIHDTLRKAYNVLSMTGKDIAQEVGPDGIYTHLPTLRVFDMARKDMNRQIGDAMRSGDGQLAEGLSAQLNQIKGAVANANPADKELQTALASMRDDFESKRALDIGTTVLQRMSKDPRVVQREFKGLTPDQQNEWRIGSLDALINSPNGKADPILYYRSLTRTPGQRGVMENIFGGKGNLGRFERWLGREERAKVLDARVGNGQSVTSTNTMAESDAAEASGNVLKDAFMGFARGGIGFAIASGVRSISNLSSGTGKLTQEEIAKILLSKGENLAKGIDAAKTYRDARQVGNRARARLVSQAGAREFTNPIQGN